MGVLELWKKFVFDNKIVDWEVFMGKGIAFSHLFDFNGAMYDVANDVYGLGDKLDGTKFADRTDIKQIRIEFESNNETVHVKFFEKLRELLTKTIIETVGATDFLIIGIDGIVVRSKSVEQCNRRFTSSAERINRAKTMDKLGEFDKEKYVFNTLEFTPGTHFMNRVCECVRIWIRANREQLASTVVFTDCSEEGEAEHKIYNIFQASIKAFSDKHNLTSKITVDEIFKKNVHVIHGKDADLCFLSLLRSDYSFYWLRFNDHLFKRENARKLKDNREFERNAYIPPASFTNINAIKKYIINKMGGDIKDPVLVKRMIIDFVLMSFLIGDDFVPAMFTLTIDSGKTLNKFMELYNENIEEHLSDENGTIDPLSFFTFLLHAKEVEEEMYNLKSEVGMIENEFDTRIRENIDTTNLIEKREFFRKMLNRDQNNVFDYNPILQNSYEDFVELWPKVILCPSFLVENSKMSNKRDLYREIAIKHSDEEIDEVCNDYLTGLQWNLYYYMGQNVNNWMYKWPLAPTISHICTFLEKFYDEDDENFVFNFDNTIREPSDNKMDPTKSIYSVMNMYLSKEIINSAISGKKGTDTKRSLMKEVPYEKITAKVKHYTSYLPVGFSGFSNGRFYNKKYFKGSETTLSVKIPNSVIFRLGVNKNILKNFPGERSVSQNLDCILDDHSQMQNDTMFKSLKSGVVTIGKQEKIKKKADKIEFMSKQEVQDVKNGKLKSTLKKTDTEQNNSDKKIKEKQDKSVKFDNKIDDKYKKSTSEENKKESSYNIKDKYNYQNNKQFDRNNDNREKSNGYKKSNEKSNERSNYKNNSNKNRSKESRYDVVINSGTNDNKFRSGKMGNTKKIKPRVEHFDF